MAISEPFAKVLAAGRTQFNQRVVEAQRRFPGLDRAVFADFLATAVDGVVRAVAAAAPDRVAQVALLAYDMALELTGHALAGPHARTSMVEQAWREVAPRYGRLIADYPVEVLGGLSNAAVNLSQHVTVRRDQWLQDMAALAPHIESLLQFQSLGQLLAWKAGMAHFRTGAIDAASNLPAAAVMAALGVAPDQPWQAVRDQLLGNPWWSPASGPQSGTEVGSFSGFGGEFAVPPQVRACPGGFFVRSGTRYFYLIADSFGAILHAATQEEFDGSDMRAPSDVAAHGTHLSINGRDVDVNLPAGFTTACNEHTVAVTSPYTHSIRLLPLQ